MGASLAGTAAFALLASPWQGHGLLLAYVVLFALCAVAMGGFLLDHLKRTAEPQSSQRAQTE